MCITKSSNNPRLPCRAHKAHNTADVSRTTNTQDSPKRRPARGGGTSIHSRHRRSGQEAHQQRSHTTNGFTTLRSRRTSAAYKRIEAPPDPTMRPLTPSSHAELLRWPDSTSAPRIGAHIESCPEGNHSILQQRRMPTRQTHVRMAEASFLSRKDDTNN